MEKPTVNRLNFDGASGHYGPSAEDNTAIDGIVADLESGELLVESDGVMPYRCIDDRYDIMDRNGPRAAGGTLSIFAGDDLTNRHYTSEDTSVVGGYRNAAASIADKGFKIGAHSGPCDDPLGSGCAASDSLAGIYGTITSYPDVVKKYAEIVLGDGGVSEDIEQMIINNARQRVVFSNGKSILDAMRDTPGAELEDFHGPHFVTLSVINWRDGTTVSKSKIIEKYGDNVGTFCVDAWALVEAASQAATTPEAIRRMLVGLIYFNIAGLLALARDGSPLVIVK